jgi:OFA family oxalate/formate antiporter-like MFS transporter
MTFFCIGGFVGGRLSKNVNPRLLLIAAALLLYSGVFGASRLSGVASEQALTMLYICYGVVCGLGVGIGYNVIVSLVVKWFPDRPGLASGTLLMGFGMGGILLGSIVSGLIRRYGLFTAFFDLAVSVAVVMTAGALILKPNKEAPTLRNDMSTPERENFTPSQMLRSRFFWCFFLFNMIISSGGLMIINSAVSIAAVWGIPPTLGLIVSLFNGGGRLIIGACFDRFGGGRTMFIDTMFMLASGLSLAAGAIANQAPLIILGFAFVGLSYGGSPALVSSVINKTYGSAYFSENFSLANFLLIPAAIIGPLTSSVLFERSGGSYFPTIVAITIFALVATALLAVMNRLKRA